LGRRTQGVIFAEIGAVGKVAALLSSLHVAPGRRHYPSESRNFKRYFAIVPLGMHPWVVEATGRLPNPSPGGWQCALPAARRPHGWCYRARLARGDGPQPLFHLWSFTPERSPSVYLTV
jgi:hypothetical protein